jgi:hypothetical protein
MTMTMTSDELLANNYSRDERKPVGNLRERRPQGSVRVSGAGRLASGGATWEIRKPASLPFYSSSFEDVIVFATATKVSKKTHGT